MTNPFDFFDFKACINLPNSTERWDQCQQQFIDNKINDVKQLFVQPPPPDIVVPSMKFASGNIGVNLSHIKCLIHALTNQSKACLVFEDDFYITEHGKDILLSALLELPSDWDVLYLGGNPKQTMQPFSSHLYKPTVMLGAFSYAVSNKFIPKLIDLCLNDLTNKPFDLLLSNVLSDVNAFTVTEPVCRTKEGFSIVRNAFRSYEKAITDNWEQYKPKT